METETEGRGREWGREEDREGEIYYKDLTYTRIMEADKSPDLQPESWRARDAGVHFQSKSKGLRTRKADSLSSRLKAGRLEAREEMMFQFKS